MLYQDNKHREGGIHGYKCCLANEPNYDRQLLPLSLIFTNVRRINLGGHRLAPESFMTKNANSASLLRAGKPCHRTKDGLVLSKYIQRTPPPPPRRLYTSRRRSISDQRLGIAFLVSWKIKMHQTDPPCRREIEVLFSASNCRAKVQNYTLSLLPG